MLNEYVFETHKRNELTRYMREKKESEKEEEKKSFYDVNYYARNVYLSGLLTRTTCVPYHHHLWGKGLIIDTAKEINCGR